MVHLPCLQMKEGKMLSGAHCSLKCRTVCCLNCSKQCQQPYAEVHPVLLPVAMLSRTIPESLGMERKTQNAWVRRLSVRHLSGTAKLLEVGRRGDILQGSLIVLSDESQRLFTILKILSAPFTGWWFGARLWSLSSWVRVPRSKE